MTARKFPTSALTPRGGTEPFHDGRKGFELRRHGLGAGFVREDAKTLETDHAENAIATIHAGTGMNDAAHVLSIEMRRFFVRVSDKAEPLRARRIGKHAREFEQDRNGGGIVIRPGSAGRGVVVRADDVVRLPETDETGKDRVEIHAYVALDEVHLARNLAAERLEKIGEIFLRAVEALRAVDEISLRFAELLDVGSERGFKVGSVHGGLGREIASCGKSTNPPIEEIATHGVDKRTGKTEIKGFLLMRSEPCSTRRGKKMVAVAQW